MALPLTQQPGGGVQVVSSFTPTFSLSQLPGGVQLAGRPVIDGQVDALRRRPPILVSTTSSSTTTSTTTTTSTSSTSTSTSTSTTSSTSTESTTITTDTTTSTWYPLPQ